MFYANVLTVGNRVLAIYCVLIQVFLVSGNMFGRQKKQWFMKLDKE